MSVQAELFRAPYQHHSATSRAAAQAIEPHLNALQARVLNHIRFATWGIMAAGGLTDEQIQQHLDMSASTERPRRVELVRMGLVKDSGRKRKTRSGRNAVVWIAVRPIPGSNRPGDSASGGGSSGWST